MLEPIYGLAVPPGRAALHLLRISGVGCHHMLSPLWQHRPLMHRQATYVFLRDDANELIDDAIVTFFQGPNSYSGEDCLEICTHGNPLILTRLIAQLERLGCRLAQPGEFTQRAYLNGKLDLTQAEAINQIIHAESENALKLARNAAAGMLSEEIRDIRALLLDALSFLEAHIDFSEDEVGSYDTYHVLQQINNVTARLTTLHSSYAEGRKLREGVHIALAGKPNAGKSSLFNALLKAERAIVTEIPGTTRDVLEDKLRLAGRDFVIFDTAGLRDTADLVERIGVQKSRYTLENADSILYLVDGQNNTEEIIDELKDFFTQHPEAQQKAQICLSKEDLWSGELLAPERLTLISEHFSCPVGTFSQNNLAWINDCLCRSFDAQEAMKLLGRSPVLLAARQKLAVEDALKTLKDVNRHLLDNDYPERIASLLNSTLQSLNEIIGEVSVDDVLDVVFSSFCIGK